MRWMSVTVGGVFGTGFGTLLGGPAQNVSIPASRLETHASLQPTIWAAPAPLTHVKSDLGRSRIDFLLATSFHKQVLSLDRSTFTPLIPDSNN